MHGELLFLHAEVYYEGTYTFRNYGRVDYSWLVQFLPYNPVIVEGGALYGNEACRAATVWPKSQSLLLSRIRLLLLSCKKR